MARPVGCADVDGAPPRGLAQAASASSMTAAPNARYRVPMAPTPFPTCFADLRSLYPLERNGARPRTVRDLAHDELPRARGVGVDISRGAHQVRRHSHMDAAATLQRRPGARHRDR